MRLPCVAHADLAPGATVSISGATLATYNVTAFITVLTATAFTYTVGSPVTPAVGSLFYTLGAVPPH